MGKRVGTAAGLFVRTACVAVALLVAEAGGWGVPCGSPALFQYQESSRAYAMTVNATPTAGNDTQLYLQRDKIVPADASDSDQYGMDVEVSGTTAIVTSRSGTYVLVRSGNSWIQQAKLAAYGYDVDISGNSILAQDSFQSPVVFTRVGAAWSSVALPSLGIWGVDYGRHLAIDGDTAVVAAHREGAGSVYVFRRSGVTWALEAKLTGTGPYVNYFGESVDIDGDTIVVGAPESDEGDTNTGACFVFVRSGTSWTQQLKVTAPGGGPHEYFGSSVSISGNTAVFGAGWWDSAAYVFTRTGTTWAHQQKLTSGSVKIGNRVRIVGDTLLASDAYYGQGADSGMATVFTRSGSTWTQRTTLLSPVGGVDLYGGAAALCTDTAFLAADWDNGLGTRRGAVYAYRFGIEDAASSVAAPGVLSNDSDPDGDALTAQLVSGPANGAFALLANGSYSFTPTADWYGADSFSYRVSDGTLESPPATAVLLSLPVNDAPSFTGGDDITLLEDAPAHSVPWASSISAGAGESHGIFFSVTCDKPQNFLVQPNLTAAGTLSFTPAPNANGVATCSVVLHDVAGGTSAAEPLLITLTPVADLPGATADTYTINEGESLSVPAPGVMANDVHPDGLPMRSHQLSGSSGTANLTIDGALTYTPPNPNWFGQDSFVYQTASGATYSPNVGVTINVLPVNDPPTFTPGTLSETVAEDSGAYNRYWASNISPGAGESGSVSWLVECSRPSLFSAQPSVASNGWLRFTPAADANGSAELTITAQDAEGGLSTPVTMTINVTAVPDNPRTSGDYYYVDEDTVLEVPAPGVLANDYDVDGDPLRVSRRDLWEGGGYVAIQPDGALTYTPWANWNGLSEWVYWADDSEGSSYGFVRIRVWPVNDAPVAAPEEYRMTPNATGSVTAASGLLKNDTDVEGTALTASLSAPASHGVATVAANGSFTYTPNAGWLGVDSFKYRASDGSTSSAEQTVTLRVEWLDNQAPISSAAHEAGWHSTPVTVTLSAVDLQFPAEDVSGVAVTEYALGSGAWVEYESPFTVAISGETTVSFRSRDHAGNAEATQTTSVFFDGEPPTTGCSAVPTYDDSSTPITLTPTDEHSGVAFTRWSMDGSEWTSGTVVPPVSTYGTHTLEFFSADEVGNREDTVRVDFFVDEHVAPVTEASVEAPFSNLGWFRAPTLVTLDATDGQSGVATTWFRIGTGDVTEYVEPFEVPRGGVTVAFWSVDRAGNAEDAGTIDVYSDGAAPVTACSAVATYDESSPPITLTPADEHSGVSYTSWSLDGSEWATGTSVPPASAYGTHTLEFFSADEVGNREETVTVRFFIDEHVAPVTEATVKAPVMRSGWYGAPAVVTLSATDGHSGVDTTFFQIGTGDIAEYSEPFEVPPGGATVSFWSRDRAGNDETPKSIEVRADDEAPVSSLSYPKKSGDWTSSPAVVRLLTSEDGSGVLRRFYSIDGGERLSYLTPFSVAARPGEAHAVAVALQAVDLVGNVETTATHDVWLDDAAPSAPTGVRCLELDTSSAFIAWNASPDVGAGTTRYAVLLDGVTAATVSTPQARLQGLTPGATRAVTVVAIDGVGNRSEASAELELAVPDAAIKVAVSAGTGTTFSVPLDGAGDVSLAFGRIARAGSAALSVSDETPESLPNEWRPLSPTLCIAFESGMECDTTTTVTMPFDATLSAERAGSFQILYECGSGWMLATPTAIDPGARTVTFDLPGEGRWVLVEPSTFDPATKFTSGVVLAQKFDGVHQPSSLTAVVPYGGTAVMAGRLSQAGGVLLGKPVYVEQWQPETGEWVETGVATEDEARGLYRYSASPRERAVYRFAFNGDRHNPPAVGPSCVVYPRASTSTPSVPRTTRVNRSFRVSGVIRPAHDVGSTKTVYLRCYRYENRRWRLRKTLATKISYRDASSSQYAASVRLPYRGVWRITAYAPSDALHYGCISPASSRISVK